MRKLRWVTDGGGFWELDMETPAVMEGTARPVPGNPLPLGVPRGSRLSRPKQLEFMHRFMAAPLVPSYHPARGFAFNHAHTFHLRDNWTAYLMERLHMRKFTAAVREEGVGKGLAWVKNVGKKLVESCAFGVGSEVYLTPDSSVIFERYKDDGDGADRTKAVFTHKLPHHDLTAEAAWPGLFMDKNCTYWDVPSCIGLDLASHGSDSGLSYHICVQHISGEAKSLLTDQVSQTPDALFPGLYAKAAMSIKKHVDVWRKKEGKLKMVQPYDVFLSDPHISASGTVGSAFWASFHDGSRTGRGKEHHPFGPICMHARGANASLFSDLFASISLSAQFGNFQRLLFDLSRFNARFDFPSGSGLVKGTSSIAHDLLNSRQLKLVAVNAVCPKVTLAVQQQIAGPFSIRLESQLAFDMKNQHQFGYSRDSVIGIEYAMQVLGSARGTLWYSPKSGESMVELRFFES